MRRPWKIQKRQVDPCEPPKFKIRRIPGRAPSPQAPILRSPPRVLNAEQQEEWKIPPPVSNWKNKNGYAVPLSKRLVSDGRELRDETINFSNFSNFIDLSEALQSAERCARNDIAQRAVLQQRLEEKDRLQNEECLRDIACQDRKDRANDARRHSASFLSPEEEAVHRRDEARKERRQELRREEQRTKLGTRRKRER